MFSELVPTDKSNTGKMNKEKEMFATIVNTTNQKERNADEDQLTLF